MYSNYKSVQTFDITPEYPRTNTGKCGKTLYAYIRVIIHIYTMYIFIYTAYIHSMY